MKIRIYPEHPNLPIGPAVGRVGSAMPIEIVGVPSRATTVGVAAFNADGTAYNVSATKQGGEWVCTDPAPHFAAYGAISRGLQVSVTFKDATDTLQTVLFVGDVRIEASAASDPAGRGVSSVPITDEVPDGSSMKGLRNTVNRLARIVSGTVTALALAFCAFGATPLEDIPGSNTVYTAAETDMAISNALSSLPPSGVTTNDVCAIVTNETVAEYSEWIVDPQPPVFYYYDISFEAAPDAGDYPYEETPGTWNISLCDVYTSELIEGWQVSGRRNDTNLVFNSEDYVAHRTPIRYRNSLGLARLSDLPGLTNGLATAASVSAANSRAANAQSAAQAASNLAANVSGVVTTWETYWDGDEVRVTVTNYDSAVHLPSLYLEQKLKNTNAYRVVWSESTRWKTNELQMAEIRSAIEEKADRAWGFYDSHTGEYAPDGYTWLSSPKIAIAGGLAYQRTLTTSGAIWVLASNGMVAQTGGDTENGFFRIKDDEGNTTFEIVRGNKRTVGATAAGIKVTSPRNSPTTTVEIPYNVVSEEHPTIYSTTDLSSGEWTELAATWLGQSGAWTAQVSSASATLFIKGEYETGGETYIRNAAPISIEGGLYATNTASGGFVKIRPKYNGSTVTWELVQ